MSLPVHLVPSLAGVEPAGTVLVEGDEAHHAVAVRRLRLGERIVLTDGMGARAIGVAAGIGKRRLEVRVESLRREPRPRPVVTVVQALPKGERGDLAVEVLTEIGVDVIVPWSSARSVAVWRGDRAAKSLARWRAIAREAAKQSRRAWFPEVAELASTAEAVRVVARADLALVLHEAATVSLPTLLAETSLSAGEASVLAGEASLSAGEASVLAVVVGPEGGLSDDEVAAYADAGAHVVRLGPEVLRTSTAGVAAVAALLSRTPRWG